MLESRGVRWGLILLAWTFLGFFFFTQTYLAYLYQSGRAPAGFLLKVSLSEWYMWAAVAPGVVWLARRFALERPRVLRGVLVHVPASLLLAVLKFNLDVLVRRKLLGMPGMPNVMNYLHSNIVTYWIIVGLTHGYDFYRRYRERELKASRLEAQLAQARLQVLKMQLHPHFLFNTLHAISTLMHRDVEAADRMIARLSELLRMTLEGAERQEVPLKEELEFLERYLEIEQTRFQDRLSVRMEIAPETLDARVPSLILQPLVENAIRHGFAKRAGPGRIEVRARRRDDRLEMQVRDDGAGLPAGRDPAAGQGLGLANTRARLAQLYGESASLELANAPEGGLAATVLVPWNTAEEQEEGGPE